MQILFRNPEFLYGLFLIAIPIIIHLFNFKRFKTVYFSDISFLAEEKRKTKSMSQLKNLLILFSRILFIIFFTLIFAQPYVPGDNIENADFKQLCIYIDNSFSSSNETSNGKIIDIAKKKAVDIANAFKTNKKFLLLTNDFNPKYNRFVNYEQFVNFVSEINISSKSKTLTQILDYYDDIGGGKGEHIYVISDFQKTFLDKKNKVNSKLNVTLIPVNVENKNNLSVDTCFFESPYHRYKSEEHLHAIIKSYSEKDYANLSAKLFINDSLRALSSFDITAGKQTEINFVYTNTEKGTYNAEIRIEDFPVIFDNSLFLNYTIKKNINVLLISDKPNTYTEKVFSVDTYFTLTRTGITKLKMSEFKKYDIIILDNVYQFSTGLISELKKFTAEGKSIILIPEVSINLIEKYNDLAREALSKGDKILSENYFQHADHFTRILAEKENLKLSREKDNKNTIEVVSDNTKLTSDETENQEKQILKT